MTNPSKEIGNHGREKPAIVCLCGSTRFREAFEEAQLQESLAGKIVLTVAGYPHHGGGRVKDLIFGQPGAKEALDELTGCQGGT